MHYRLGDEEWKKYFEKCEQVDTERQWIGRQLVPERTSFNIIQNYLEAVKAKDKAQIEKLHAGALENVDKNECDVEALLRLSIMAKFPEKFDNYLASLKALDRDEKDIEQRIQAMLGKN